VPNVSEGRDVEIIEAIRVAADSVVGAKVLHVDSSEDANRTVYTIAGEPEAVEQSAFLLVKKSAELIDMREHQGVHPRIGATDVCPIIPISGVAMSECVSLSKRLAMKIATDLKLAVFLYEESASVPERRNLANIRRGNYEGLKNKLTEPNWIPDFGPEVFNPKFGAIVVGARDFLIAYNINLDTGDVSIAKEIAKKFRNSRNKHLNIDGMTFDSLKAIGWYLEANDQAQVSINLTDYKSCGMHHAFEACKNFALELGAKVVSSELIGLVPRQALLEAGQYYVSSSSNETELVEAAIKKLKLSYSVTEFIKSRVLESHLKYSS
jgi:glutamate formiminotransferase/formiminotetrahydrofolate cyclodeaminase